MNLEQKQKNKCDPVSRFAGLDFSRFAGKWHLGQDDKFWPEHQGFEVNNGGLATSEGSPTANLPLRAGKGWLYEGGIREPMIIRWPGVVRPGSVCDQPVTSTDFYPTMLEMAGLPVRPAQHVDGASLVPLLKESGALDRQSIFWHYPHYSNQGGRPGGAVRSGRYKLIEHYEDMSVELYDLVEDVGETRDLAAIMPKVGRRLAAATTRLAASGGGVRAGAESRLRPRPERRGVNELQNECTRRNVGLILPAEDRRESGDFPSVPGSLTSLLRHQRERRNSEVGAPVGDQRYRFLGFARVRRALRQWAGGAVEQRPAGHFLRFRG